MDMIDATGVIERTGMDKKAKDTMITKWPVGRVGGKLDFYPLLRSGSSGGERYVEWVRKE